MAETLTVKKDTLAQGVQVKTGASYEIAFVAAGADGKDPVGELNVVVRDHDGHDPVAGAPFKITGPHGVSESGKTGKDGDIHLTKPVPIDTYTLHLMDTDFPVVPRPKGGQPLFVRIPGANSGPPPARLGFGPPPRAKEGMPGGREFLKSLKDQSGSFSPEQREIAILEQLKQGNVPEFCRHFASLTLHDKVKNVTGTLEVMIDYIAIGNDDDYVRVPLSGLTMQKVADAWGCAIPTRKVVQEAYEQATNKLVAHNLGFWQHGSMWQASNWAIMLHDDIIQGKYVCERGTKGPPEAAGRVEMAFELNHKGKCQLPPPHPLTLSSGHRKEVIIHPDDLSVHLAFYGWFQADGKAIQGAGGCKHGPAFADCSHGNRLCAPTLLVNGKTMSYADVLQDKDQFGVLSDAGVFPKHSLRYPDIEMGHDGYHKYLGG